MKSYPKGLGFLVLGLALVFITVGIFREEVVTVINKATAICMECIGLG